MTGSPAEPFLRRRVVHGDFEQKESRTGGRPAQVGNRI
jgi:hypothetical protein